MDHSIAPLSLVKAAHIKHDDLANLFASYPNIAKAVQASQVADESRLRASITSIGRHNAQQRLGYILCDLWSRAKAFGLIAGDCLDLPLTQTDVADAIGLTAVHVNRMMQRLRGNGLLDLKERCLTLPDFDRLARVSGYRMTATGNDHDYQASAPNGYALKLRLPSTDSHSFFPNQ